MNDKFFENYSQIYSELLSTFDWSCVEQLATVILDTWRNKKCLYLCGNGGSASNAEHLACDFLYAISANGNGKGMKVNALSANSPLLTCLGNDLGYENIYSKQVEVLAEDGDMLLVFSGSGNSENLVRVINQAKSQSLYTAGILGFSGGKCKDLVDLPIHFESNDMQKCEDFQLMVGHMISQWLSQFDKKEAL